MAQDPWIEKYGTTPTSPTAPPPPSPSAGQDPWIAKYGSGIAGLTGGPAPVATPSVASQDPWIAKYSSPENGINPESGHDESDRFTQEDPNDNWLQKGWSIVNKPLTESLFGWGQYRSGAGGLERGAEKVLSGLTSPLSLLTLAAFAPASIGESVAGTAIKEGLMSEVAPLLGEGMDAAKAGSTVETYAKALGAAKKALVANTDIDEAVTAAGMDPAHYTKIGEFLKDQGLRSDDVLAEGTVRRMAAQGLKKAGMSPAGAVAVAKGAETLVNAGFAMQQIQSAVYSFPRFADLMEHGQYDEAGEYLVTGGAGVLFGGLGAAHSLHSLDTLVPGLNEKSNLPVTEGSRTMMNMVKARDEEIGTAYTRFNTMSNDAQRDVFKLAGVDIPESLQSEGTFGGALLGSVKNVADKVLHKSPVDDPRLAAFRKVVNFWMQSGGDRDLLYQQGHALAEAMGSEGKAFWDNSVKDFVKPTRSVEDITKEQTSNLSLVKNQIATGQENIKSLEDSVSKTSLLRDRAKSPDMKAQHQKTLDEFQTRLQEAQATQESAQKQFEDLKKWEGNPDEALKAHHQDLVRQFYEAKANQPSTEPSPENGTALDEFNRRANLMGHVGRDAQVIQEAHPEWFGQGEKPLGPNFNLRYEAADQDNPFYLKSERTLGKIQGNKPRPKQAFLNELTRNGVSKEELRWTGLDKLLTGDGNITPEEIRAHQAAHEIQVIEVPHGSPAPSSFSPENEARYTYLKNKVLNDYDNTPFGEVEEYDDLSKKRIHANANKEPTKFSRGNLVLPGGKDQGELLFQMPQIAGEYQEPHWGGTPGVVGHARFNTRQTPAGRMLHIEEIQAQLLQTGAAEGYKGELKLQPNGLPEGWRVEERQLKSGNDWMTYDENGESVQSSYSKEKAIQAAQYTAQERIEKSGRVPEAPFKGINQWPEFMLKRLVRYAAQHGYDGISWTGGAEQLKRYPGLTQVADELRYNPERQKLRVFKNGVETKEIHAEPKDLPGMIGKETSDKLLGASLGNSELGRFTQSDTYGGEPVYKAKVTGGDAYISHNTGFNWRVDLPKGEELGGFKTAEEAMKAVQEDYRYTGQREHTITGKDLEVGGKFHKYLYDKIVPEVLNKMGKRFGTRVGETNLGEGIKFTPEEQKIADRFRELKEHTTSVGNDLDAAYDKYWSETDPEKRSPEDLQKLQEHYKRVADARKAGDDFYRAHRDVSDKLRQQDNLGEAKKIQYLPISQEMRDVVNGEQQPFFKQVHASSPATPEQIAGIQSKIENLKAVMSRPIDPKVIGVRGSRTPEQTRAWEKQTKEEDLARTQLKATKTQLAYLTNKSFGEVHELSNGTKVAFLGPETVAYLAKLSGGKGNFVGIHMPRSSVDILLSKIDKSRDPYKADLQELLQKARNKNGSIITSEYGDPSKPFGERVKDTLPTFLEELTHGWQRTIGGETKRVWSGPEPTSEQISAFRKIAGGKPGTSGNLNYLEQIDKIQKAVSEGSSFKEAIEEHGSVGLAQNLGGSLITSYSKPHLTDADLAEVHKIIPKKMVKYLNDRKYAKDKDTRVVEAAAKMISDKPSEFGLTPEEAHGFLSKYFEKITKQHGGDAVDRLFGIIQAAEDLHGGENSGTIGRIKEIIHGKSEPIKPAEVPVEGTGAEPVSGVEGGQAAGSPEGEGTPEVAPAGPPQQPPQVPGGLTTIPPEDLEGFQGNKQATWEQGPRHAKLPDDLEGRVEKAKPIFQKMATDNRSEYQHRLDVLKGYSDAARGVSPEVQALVDKLRKADDEIWAAGSNNNLIHSYIENHLYRDWGKDSGVGNELLAQARAGNFATNIIQARHRVYQTPLEGFLAGKKLQNYDPVEMIRKNGVWTAEAAANRKVVDSLLKSGLTNSRGMPLFLLKGSGNVVEGEDGQSAASLVNPDKIKTVDIDPKRLEAMKQNGQLASLLSSREVVDRTPRVSLDTIPEWINSVKKKLSKLEQTNPLLGEGFKAARRHKESWDQIGTFVKDRAARSAQYIRDTLKAAEANGGRTSTDVPSDIAVTPYITKILHSGGNLTPRDISRVSAYAEKLETQAEGASNSAHWKDPKEGTIRPSEVAELLRMNKKFIPPELQKYLDEQHDKFTYDKDGKPVRTADGNWDTKGMTTAMRSVEHVANSAEYPQLQHDLADLTDIHNRYSSVNPISQANARPEAEKLLSDINSRQPEKFQFAPKPGDYQEIDHPAFQNWNFMSSTPDGTAVLAKTGVMVDKSIHSYIVNRLGLETSALRKTEGIGKITAPILKGGAEAKSLLLSGSPFHVIQEMIRGLMLGVNPLIRPNAVADLTTKFDTVRGQKQVYRLAARNGMIFGGSHEGSDFTEGLAAHSKLVSKIPVWGPISDEIHSMLFDRYIPALKASAFKKMFDKYASAHTDWSDDAVAEHAAKHVNNAFGGQNWKEMGRSATTQDWFNLVALAPDWLESEMRFAASTMNNAGLGAGKYREDEGKNFSRQQVAVMAAGTYMMARVLNGLYSGDPHFETPFGLATKDKDGKTIEFGVRTLPGDIMHLAASPMSFLQGRESPFVRTAQELITGRNQFGQKLTDGEKFVDTLSQFSPIGFQNVMKGITGTTTGSDVGNAAQLAKSSGATASVYRSPAQKLAANLAAERSEEGAMSPQKVAKHRVILKLEEDLKSGRLTGQGLQDMADNGQLDQDSVKNILKVVKETTGLDPENTRLYSRVSRIDAPGMLEVWDQANPSERQFLQPLIDKKAKSYLKKMRTGATAQERMSDPTFIRLRQLFPQTIEAPE